MFKLRKGFRFERTSDVAQALGLSKTFVSLVVHGKATSQRVADYLYSTYNIVLDGYNYKSKEESNEKTS